MAVASAAVMAAPMFEDMVSDTVLRALHVRDPCVYHDVKNPPVHCRW